MCQEFCPGGGESAPLNAGDTPPPAQCMLGDTGNKQAVRILLECDLVSQAFVCPRGGGWEVWLLSMYHRLNQFGRTPPPEIHGILPDTVIKRAVRILLECFLVFIYFWLNFNYVNSLLGISLLQMQKWTLCLQIQHLWG